MKQRLEALYYAAGIVVGLGVAFNIGKGSGETARESEVAALQQRLAAYDSLQKLNLQDQLEQLLSASAKLAQQTGVIDELSRERERNSSLQSQLDSTDEELRTLKEKAVSLSSENQRVAALLAKTNETLRKLAINEETVLVSTHGATTLLNGALSIGVEGIYSSWLYATLNGERHEFRGGSQANVEVYGLVYRVTLVETAEDGTGARFHVRRAQ